MGIAPENGGYLVLLAEAQQLKIVVAGCRFVALRGKGVVVDFEQGVGLFGCQHKGLEVEFCRSVARMTDDVYLGVADDVEHACCVLCLGTSLIAFLVDAGNGDVKPIEIFVIEVETAFGVEDVDLAPHQDTDSVEMAGHDEHVAEIDEGASAFDAGTVFGDAQHLQTFVRGGLRHLLQTAVGVSRRYGVGVGIYQYFSHICLQSRCYTTTNVGRNGEKKKYLQKKRGRCL